MPRNKSKSRTRPFRLVGNGQLSGSLSNTSAAGAFVLTRYEIDTTLVQSWVQAGQLFVRWRILSLSFHFKAIKGTTTEGNAGICFLPDPNETSPGNTSQAYTMESSVYGHIYSDKTLKIKPKHNKWLYTRDAVASTDDRLEMPGDVVYWTDNTTSAFPPGIASVSYVVEFDQVANNTVTPALQPKTVSTDNKEEETGEITPSELKVALQIIRNLRSNKKQQAEVSSGLPTLN